MRDSSPSRWWPSATYRWQLTPTSGFDDVRRHLPYLHRLGVDTVYLSPVFSARHGSQHGYDGVDPSRFDDARGGEAAFRALARAAHRIGLHLLLDIVPNHLAASPENPAWLGVLERGRRSSYARLFDIDWDRFPGRRPQVAVPWLDRPLSEAFRDGTVAFERQGDEVRLRVHGSRLPVSSRALRRACDYARREKSARPVRAMARVDRCLARLNRGSTAEELRRRDALLSDLDYRLVPWYEPDAINYRRFADVSDLVAVRPNGRFGFAYLHRGLLRAARRGEVDGVRVDHVDGIADPAAYLRRLVRELRTGPARRRAPYIVVEKILAERESLRSDWRVEGTTGYEVLTRISQVLVPVRAHLPFDAVYRSSCRRGGSFDDEAYRARRDVLDQLFPGDRAEIARRLRGDGHGRIPRALAPGPDAPDAALSAVTAALPVYRTYYGTRSERPEDRAIARHAALEARRRAPTAVAGVDGDRLLREFGGHRTTRARRSGFLVRWQQWTPAVAAKGIEDTAFYRYVRFVGANEVGGDPGRIGCPIDEFHAFMVERALRWPHALTPTSTHDTKWGEDARARFVVLAELADRWSVSVRRWMAAGAPRSRRGRAAGFRPITPTEEYLLYQTWLGTAPAGGAFGPSYLERLGRFAVKAAREAREATSWLHPDLAHEGRLRAFLRTRSHGSRHASWRRDMDRWVRTLDHFGGFYSLAQVVLRTTLPGVPDIYQGSEGWNLAMVDPDNRRRPPLDRLARELDRIGRRAGPEGLPAPLLRSARRGVSETLKVGVTACLLRFRRAHRTLFDRGDYRPLRERTADGIEPVLAFSRRYRREGLVVAVGRGLVTVAGPGGTVPMGSRWSGRTLPLPSGAPTGWRDVISGRAVATVGPRRARRLDLAVAFRDLPIAVLSTAPK